LNDIIKITKKKNFELHYHISLRIYLYLVCGPVGGGAALAGVVVIGAALQEGHSGKGGSANNDFLHSRI
jgi:hypothetical protein